MPILEKLPLRMPYVRLKPHIKQTHSSIALPCSISFRTLNALS